MDCHEVADDASIVASEWTMMQISYCKYTAATEVAMKDLQGGVEETEMPEVKERFVARED